MSTPHAQERLEAIFEEVKIAFPYYDEEKQVEIAMKRFDEELVWHLDFYSLSRLLLPCTAV